VIRTIVLLGKTHNFWQLLKDSAVPSVAMIGLIGFVVWASLRFRSWYHNDSGLAADRDEMLLQFRDLQRRGDLSTEEFRSIKGRLVDESASNSPFEIADNSTNSADLPSIGTDANDQQGRDTEETSDQSDQAD
jgi:hypothetical protein